MHTRYAMVFIEVRNIKWRFTNDSFGYITRLDQVKKKIMIGFYADCLTLIKTRLQ